MYCKTANVFNVSDCSIKGGVCTYSFELFQKSQEIKGFAGLVNFCRSNDLSFFEARGAKGNEISLESKQI